MADRKFFQEFRIYKPRKTKDGAASSMEYSRKDDGNRMLFWTSVLEVPSDGENAAFGWKIDGKVVTMKLGIPDIGLLLAVLNGRTAEAKLFHQNAKGSTTLTLTKDRDKGIYFLRVTGKKGNDDPIKINHSVTYAEGEVMRVLLERFVALSFAWV